MTTIATATFEDLATIASWLCPMDRKELAVTRDPDDYLALARDAYASNIHKVALDEAARPVFAFGAYPTAPDTAHVWAFKTRDGLRAVRAVTKYLIRELIPALRSAGVLQAMCYVHQENYGSQKWLAHLGFRPEATPGEFGTQLICYRRTEPVELLAAS